MQESRFSMLSSKKTGTLSVPVDKEELGFNKKRGSHFTPSAVIRVFPTEPSVDALIR